MTARRIAGPVSDLALGVLGGLARLLQSVLPPLFLPTVARQEAGLLEYRPEIRVELGEGARDRVPQGAGLSRDPSPLDLGDDVVAALGIRASQGLVHDHAMGHARKVVVDGTAVDRPGAASRHQPSAAHGLLAPAGGAG